MKPEVGDILTFRGCCWDDGWEFGAPLIIYEPVKRYCESGGVGAVSVADKVVDICIDLCSEPNGLLEDWHPSDLKEFKWRGWSPEGFKRRKAACHAEITVRFIREEDREIGFEVIAAAELDIVSGKLTPIFRGTPTQVIERDKSLKE